jgi:hypothetical protein
MVAVDEAVVGSGRGDGRGLVGLGRCAGALSSRWGRLCRAP